MSDELSFTEIESQQAELLPTRIVLSSFFYDFDIYGDDGGDGGDGGDGNKGGDAKGGDGGDSYAVVDDNVNVGIHNDGDVVQENTAVSEGGEGGDAKGGDVHANGGDGGNGGDNDFNKSSK